MPFTNLFMGEIFGEGPPDPAPLRFLHRLLPQSNGHLTAALGAALLDLSFVETLPMASAVVSFVNEGRYNSAIAAARDIENIGMTQGFAVETHVFQKPLQELVESCIGLARVADLCVLARPKKEMGAHMSLVEGILFDSGRPLVLVPTSYKEGDQFLNVAIAWDGSARAARAVGDATSIISKADTVQIVCVSEESKRIAAGADLAAQLSRRCKKVELVDLPAINGDVGSTIRNHTELTRSDILIMGAYAHARVLEMVIGGVTRTMMLEATIPVFMSF
jgi:nucleotide-binding universal stress UspA family protein